MSYNNILGRIYGGSNGVLTTNTTTGSGDAATTGSLTCKDVMIDGQSLKEHLRQMNERLVILQPKPELLEKYEALKEAYNHYKMLESLLVDANTFY